MPSSPVTSMTSLTADTVAPGAPAFAGPLTQTSNTSGTVDCILPTQDSDGSALTGLKHLYVAVAPGADAFAGMSADDIKVMAGVNITKLDVTDSDAGTTKNVPVIVISAGATQTEACWTDDDAV